MASGFEEVTAEDVRERIDSYLDTMNTKNSTIEVSFYVISQKTESSEVRKF